MIVSQLKPGDRFRFTYIPREVELLRIIESQFGKKLPELNYEWLDLKDGSKFTNREQDMQSIERFKTWLPIIEDDEEL